jgi:hypothetical protein
VKRGSNGQGIGLDENIVDLDYMYRSEPAANVQSAISPTLNADTLP